MNSLKSIPTRFPEYYLFVLAFLAGYTPPFSINPFVIILMVILVLQIIFKSKITGLIMASLFMMINLYIILALISEFNEFPTFNAEAKKLLFGGLSIITLNIIMSGAMLFKYTQNGLKNFLLAEH